MCYCIAGFLVFSGPPSEFPSESSSRKTPEQFTVPPPWIPFPSKLCFRLHEARRLFSDSVELNLSGVSDYQRLKLTLDGCKAVATRSSTEVESQWLELLPKLYEKPVIPVGLLQPETEGSGGSEGNHILHWLSKQSSRSVVYIAFGSEATLRTEFTHELARGLELAKLPFIWALRKPSDIAADFEELLPEGFEERTKGYGIIAKGWVPQLKILDHESVGGFLTHCGWSSVIENFHYGHPLVLLPIFIDHGIIARILVEKGIAVEIERDEEDGSFTKEAVAAAVRLAVVEEEGEWMRRRAKELREVLVNKDRQGKYIDEFINYLQNHESKTSNA
ncbi:uncharacterized protein A4U43_C06F10240 [Asparagus officinalis]|uniref:UDP-glycosyltransferases domain-containing protein n=1 Tax=Asparagus officinalis TaxID=4686 RepID=A0A5P1EP92_ASPOF|nr:uncharacterized protein A4U43_C06F10240 [Asparagus officinalis]